MSIRPFLICLPLIAMVGFSACSDSAEPKATETIVEPTGPDQAEIDRLNEWFAAKYDRDLNDSPWRMTSLGMKDRQGELDDNSEAHALEKLEWAKADLTELNSFNPDVLDEQSRISWELYKQKSQMRINNEQFRHYGYVCEQMHGIQSELPAFMLNMHKVEDHEDARAYINRLMAFTKYFENVIENLKLSENKGIIPPKFVFAHLYNDCNNIIGNPKKPGENIFMKDLKAKMETAEIHQTTIDEMLMRGEMVVATSVIPAYQGLVDYLKQLEEKATTDDGVWKFPNGGDYYKYRLKLITTTDMTPDEIFNTGKAEVERIHTEMREIMAQVGFEGELQDFFKFMREDKQFYFPDSDEGREQIIGGYEGIMTAMDAKIDDYFATKYKAPVQVKAVEAYREKSAGKAFYQRAALDGSRPGTFYANLYKMADMPRYEMEALAYHEAIPGHHMQISIAQELTDLPNFRKHSHYTAYSEGWGLYCELLPKEMGFYTDPYSDFGRLSMELWRACRLIVDVGIHDKKWTREEAIAFLVENTPNSENSCRKAIERYIVMPGQATAYKVGMLKILEVREKAKAKLGDAFDIKVFHDIFLKSGPVPLNVFESNVDRWIEANAKTS